MSIWLVIRIAAELAIDCAREALKGREPPATPLRYSDVKRQNDAAHAAGPAK